MFTSYPELVIYLLRKYTKDDLISRANEEIEQFRQPTRIFHSEYAQELWTKALKPVRIQAPSSTTLVKERNRYCG